MLSSFNEGFICKWTRPDGKASIVIELGREGGLVLVEELLGSITSEVPEEQITKEDICFSHIEDRGECNACLAKEVCHIARYGEAKKESLDL